jgi:CHASE3 domain sensor protein
MKKTLIICFSVFVLLITISSCVNTKNTTNNNNKTIDKSQLVATVDEKEPQLSEAEIGKIEYFAKKMAGTYCQIKIANQKYAESGGNEEVLNDLKKLEQEFSDYEKKVELYFTTDLQKKEFDKLYTEHINRCK